MRRSSGSASPTASTSSPARCRAAGSSAWRWPPASCTSRRLLLLDEPTAGVDPKARREFWDEIHELAAEGLTVLVSTHYMDEAERCHRIVYIAYGTIVARGTVAEVIAASGLTPRRHPGRRHGGSPPSSPADGVEQVAPFGNDLHVVGRDPATGSSASVARDRRGASASRPHRRDQPRGRLHPPDDDAPDNFGNGPEGRHEALSRILRGDGQGVHPDAARPPDLRHDHRRFRSSSSFCSATPSTPTRSSCRRRRSWPITGPHQPRDPRRAWRTPAISTSSAMPSEAEARGCWRAARLPSSSPSRRLRARSRARRPAAAPARGRRHRPDGGLGGRRLRRDRALAHCAT
jgi:hypothetical protein